MRIVLNLRAESPVAFRTGRAAGRAATLPYIPGSVLLGGLAAAHTALYPDQTEQFGEFFVRGRVRYGNAYPASFRPTQQALHDEMSPVRPLPTTARSCKRWPGFRFQRDADHEYHGVFDHLVPWALFALSGERAIDPLERVAACPECDAALDTFAGFYRRVDTARAIGRSAQDTLLLTRTGISRATGAVHTGILYSREALPEGTTFWAELTMPDELFDEFRDFADEAGGEGLLRVGTNRTRGLGRLAVVSCRQSEEAAATAAVGGRVRAWNEVLKQAADEAGIALPPGVVRARDACVRCAGARPAAALGSAARRQHARRGRCIRRHAGLPHSKHTTRDRLEWAVGASAGRRAGDRYGLGLPRALRAGARRRCAAAAARGRHR